jgi:hypothetical protein
LIELFQEDLKIKDLTDIDPDFFHLCIEVFSQYCIFIYKHQSEPLYDFLNKKFADAQGKILTTSCPSAPSKDESIVCKGITGAVTKIGKMF